MGWVCGGEAGQMWVTSRGEPEGCGLYSRQQARNISRSSGTVSFSETLSLAPMKSTPATFQGDCCLGRGCHCPLHHQEDAGRVQGQDLG